LPAINCEHPREDGEACNTCESCQAFNEQRSYNIFELDAASNNGVDQIKTLMEQTRIPPQVGKYKVFIIDEVHMLSAAAFNAFLKTLEEPPSHVIFILATTEKHKILPTILSRCQIYDFERMTVPNTIAHLKMVAEKEGIQYEEQALAVIAEKADGGMRDALSIFDQAASFCQGDITYQKVIEDLNVLDSDNYFKLVDLALENKVSQMMLLLDNILGKGFDGGNMIQGLAQHVRNVMMAKDTQTLPLLETSEEQKAKYVEQAKKAPTPFLYKALQLMNNCDVQYRQSSNKRLLVELTLIQIGQITQPEDQDVPSAGRTPHRLKSLFQKIVAQLKPASQGAGAGQESGSKAPVREAQPVAAATAAPISTVRKGSQVKLKGIGMSFANLEKTEQNSQRIYNPIDQLKEETPASTGAAANHDQPFTQEQVEGQWISMCLRMQGIKDFIGLANRMKPIVPTITDFPHIEVVIDNKLLLDDVVKIKGRILQTFRIGLNNSQVTLDYRLAESDEVTRILSKQEILENMIKENPAIGKLTQDLRLVMA
jgi:DNA polymerase III subunit gamma/tau